MRGRVKLSGPKFRYWSRKRSTVFGLMPNALARSTSLTPLPSYASRPIMRFLFPVSSSRWPAIGSKFAK